MKKVLPNRVYQIRISSNMENLKVFLQLEQKSILLISIRDYFTSISGYFRNLFLVRSTANLKCYWGGKTCAKWTNHIIEQQSCDDPELGYLDLDKSTDRFCDNDLQLDWVELGGRRIGNTKLIMRTKRRIWYVFMR